MTVDVLKDKDVCDTVRVCVLNHDDIMYCCTISIYFCGIWLRRLRAHYDIP